LWVAVDKITKPRKVPVERAADAEFTSDLGGFCSVAKYRAASSRYATIPSLWQQAEQALSTGMERADGDGSSPLRERAPADLDLMEVMSIIRETTRHELVARGVRRPPSRDGVPAQFTVGEVRRLAVLVLESPDEVWWWEYRFGSWARLLESYLDAADRRPRPVRLRNAACPLCKTRSVVVEVDGERQMVAPLVVEFRDGLVRAARCEACGGSWFRGVELVELAGLVGGDTALTA
jgi:hypothetical protein